MFGLECVILGDSIAVGTIQARPTAGCIEMAKGGINSRNWNIRYGDSPALDMSYNYAIISLGSNDLGIDTRKELESIRSKVQAKRVYWVLPAIKPAVQEIVRETARRNGDTVLEIRGLSKDGVHPTGQGYKDIFERVK